MLLATTGLGAALTVTIAVAVNLSLTPTLLLTFPSFFSEMRYAGLGCLLPRAARRRLAVIHVPSPFAVFPATAFSSTGSSYEPFNASFDAPLSTPSSEPMSGAVAEPLVLDPAKPNLSSELLRRRDHMPRRPAWQGLATCTRRYSVVVVAAVVAVAVPCAVQTLRITTSIDFDLLLPDGAPATVAYKDLITSFGTADIDPYVLLLQPKLTPPNATVANQLFFDDVNRLVLNLASRSGPDGGPLLNLSTVTSVTGRYDPIKTSGWEPVPAFVWRQLEHCELRLCRQCPASLSEARWEDGCRKACRRPFLQKSVSTQAWRTMTNIHAARSGMNV
eukprot:6040178-Pleurochrysis_carterae.AAC.6